MRANIIISKYKYPFMSREQSTLVATLTYVRTLSRIPLPDDEERYGVHQYQRLRKTLMFPKQFYLPTQSELQMCWHDLEHIRIWQHAYRYA